MSPSPAVPWRPSPGEIDALFAPLASYAHVLLAVSGGPDSMALLHLAAQWARRTALAPELSAATVDHGLRDDAHAEAVWTGAEAMAAGVPHSILSWDSAKPATRLQEAARDARYRLLAAHADAQGLQHCAIVTAHTADDQAETLLMRLARGSGADGLAGMRAVRPLAPGGPDLVRPLLCVTKAALISWLRGEGLAWCEDPSNTDPRFERVRVRQAIARGGDALPSASMMALSARRLARAASALEVATGALQMAAVDFKGGAYAQIDAARFAAAPEELRVRLMTRVLAAFAGETPPADLAQVEQLVGSLGQPGAVRTSLGGALVRACPKEIRVFREAGRIPAAGLLVQPGETQIWDGRFEVTVEGASGDAGAGPLTVRALPPLIYSRLRRFVRDGAALPARAAATLPSFWLGADLIAVPALQDAVIASELGRHGTRFRAGARFVSGPGLSQDVTQITVR